jgi:hypothetical protein
MPVRIQADSHAGNDSGIPRRTFIGVNPIVRSRATAIGVRNRQVLSRIFAVSAFWKQRHRCGEQPLSHDILR